MLLLLQSTPTIPSVRLVGQAIESEVAMPVGSVGPHTPVFYSVDGDKNQHPTVAMEIDFTNDPTNPQRIWTDVMADVRQLSYASSGRNTELQRSEPGTLDAVLNNRHGNYDPTNAASPHYPGVKRMRWVRVIWQWAGVQYPRWQGVIEEWKLSWPGSKDAVATIRAVDTFKVANLFDLEGESFPAQRTDERVAAILSSASLVLGAISVGQSSVDPVGPFGREQYALAHLLDVEGHENGLLFAQPDGAIGFQDRHFRPLRRMYPRATIGDGGGAEIPYRETQLALADDDVFTEAAIETTAGATAIATDAASESAHFARRLTRQAMNGSIIEATDAAHYLIRRYADSPPRLPEVGLLGANDPTKWPTILSTGLSDRLAWIRRGGHTISSEVFVEKVADEIDMGREARVSVALSPASLETWWILGDATYGELGSTTRLGY